jgi:hypothetical protein
MALAANDGDNLNSTMGAMADRAGATGDALNRQSKGAMFQFQLAMNQLRRAGIELGNELIPIITKDIIPAIERFVKWFGNLSDEAKRNMLIVGGLAAAGGPLLLFVGGVIRAIGAVSKLAGLMGKLGGQAGGLNLPTPAAGGGGAAGTAEGAGAGATTAEATTGGTAAGGVFAVAMGAAAEAGIVRFGPRIVDNLGTSIAKSVGASPGMANAIGNIEGWLQDQAANITIPGAGFAKQIFGFFDDLPSNPPKVFTETADELNKLQTRFTAAQAAAFKSAVANEQWAKATSIMRQSIAQANAELAGQGKLTVADLHSVEAYRSSLLGTSKEAQDLGKWININNGLTQDEKTHLAQVTGGALQVRRWSDERAASASPGSDRGWRQQEGRGHPESGVEGSPGEGADGDRGGHEAR